MIKKIKKVFLLILIINFFIGISVALDIITIED